MLIRQRPGIKRALCGPRAPARRSARTPARQPHPTPPSSAGCLPARISPAGPLPRRNGPAQAAGVRQARRNASTTCLRRPTRPTSAAGASPALRTRSQTYGAQRSPAIISTRSVHWTENSSSPATPRASATLPRGGSHLRRARQLFHGAPALDLLFGSRAGGGTSKQSQRPRVMERAGARAAPDHGRGRAERDARNQLLGAARHEVQRRAAQLEVPRQPAPRAGRRRSCQRVLGGATWFRACTARCPAAVGSRVRCRGRAGGHTARRPGAGGRHSRGSSTRLPPAAAARSGRRHPRRSCYFATRQRPPW